MQTRTLLAAVALTALTSACGPIRVPGAPSDKADTTPAQTDTATAPEAAKPEAAPEVVIASSAIDWESARRDMASQPVPEGGAVSIASGPTDTAVPILLPSSPVTTASADGEAMRFRPLSDGYYAVYPGADYDMIINGTDKLAAAPDGAPVSADSELRFEETMTGAQVAFSRYGASYLVEFACKSDEAITGPSCITEQEALAAVQDLLVAGTQ